MIPRATYRLQFHKAFTFADAASFAPYFKRLGISHIYASPILTARAGSPHGYDVIDHTRVNPELGGEEGLRAFVAVLRSNGLGIIADIVPNHMAVGGADNPWWLDVLERGIASPYAAMFDIDWDSPDTAMRGKVLLPLLGQGLEDALAARELKLIWDEALNRLAFAYFEHRLPLRREDYPEVLADAVHPREAELGPWNTPGALAALLSRQHYRLAHWQTAPDAINWRRFFDITGLAALRTEDEPVFEAVHAKLFELYAEGLLDGLRVDHVDGLTDPRTYCRRLRMRLDELDARRPADAPAGPAYIIVEKILAADEMLPCDWGVDGTTGYDFMNDVSAVQHDARSEDAFTQFWARISGRAAGFDTEECIARCELLHASFASHLRAAASHFHRLALFAGREIGDAALEQALEAILERFHAYRTYATGDSPDPQPGPPFEFAVAAARKHIAPDAVEALDFIAATMRGELGEFGRVAWRAARYFNQLAAPVAAKAVEDTAFFRYGRLLSRNDVGFAPGTFAFSPAQFEDSAKRRGEAFPHSLLATATHDHKRGEDVRARLAVLSEIPEAWQSEVNGWFGLNAPLRTPEIGAGDEYQLYQILAGTFPADFTPGDERLPAYAERILRNHEKSLKEAKLKTSWTDPNTPFERAHADFVRAILDPTRSRKFLDALAAFVGRIAPAGAMNGLVQCILRCTLPGVPDLYQGAEFWDFSLTDPDNRRDVDFAARADGLASEDDPVALLPHWKDGRVKQALIARLLAVRAEEQACFSGGDYRPLKTQGPRAVNAMAFLRQHADRAILVAVPRLGAEPCAETGLPLPPASFWDGTRIANPDPGRTWESALDPASAFSLQAQLDCAVLFADFPGAILHRKLS